MFTARLQNQASMGGGRLCELAGDRAQADALELSKALRNPPWVHMWYHWNDGEDGCVSGKRSRLRVHGNGRVGRCRAPRSAPDAFKGGE